MRTAVLGALSAGGRSAQGIPRALHAIAGMLGGVAGDDPVAEAAIQRMRQETNTLELLSAVDLDRAAHVRAALEEGSAALKTLARSRGASWLDPWVDAAEAAVRKVDPMTPLGLQRAACQDALRAIADTVLVAEQFAEPMARSTPR